MVSSIKSHNGMIFHIFVLEVESWIKSVQPGKTLTTTIYQITNRHNLLSVLSKSTREP